MARMSIDDTIGRDPRITILADLLGWSRREAVGCLVTDIWPICYDQRTWLVSERVIDAAAGHSGFTAALIECELATRDRSGKVNIRGAKERIRYLDHKSAAGREGGLKSAESRRKTPKQTSSTGGSTPQAAGNPPVPDSASASPLVPVPERERAREHESIDRIHGSGAARQSGKDHVRRTLFNETWQLAASEFVRLQANGIDREARNAWAGLPVHSSKPAKDLFARIDELIIGDEPNVAHARDVLRNRVLVAFAEARRHGHAQYVTPMRMWNEDSFHIAAALTPEQAANPPGRHGPRSAHADEPVRRIRTL